MKNSFKKYISLLLVLMLLVSVLPMGVLAEQEDFTPSYLAFTSDTHNMPDNTSAVRLDNWITNVSASIGAKLDVMGICGDIGSALDGNAAFWNGVKAVIDKVEANPNVKLGVYTNGNHEVEWPGKAHEPANVYNTYSKYYTRVGEAVKTDDYAVFCFGVGGDGSQNFYQEDIDALEAYLNTCDPTDPVFVMSHFPLHSYSNRIIGNSAKVISVLNKHPNAIFLWGHNHTETDPHYCTVYTGSVDGTPINFTYVSAGCMCDSEYHNGQGKSTLGKGLVAKVNDDTVELSFYDVNYKSLGTTEIDVNTGSVIIPEVSGYVSVSNFTGGGKFIISAEGYALTSAQHNGYQVTNDSGTYGYSGFEGRKLELNAGLVTNEVTDSILWTAVKTADGFALKNSDGKYLTAVYGSNTVFDLEKGGYIELSDTAQSWTLDEKGLKNVTTGKYLTWDKYNPADPDDAADDISGHLDMGAGNLFTVRSGADAVTLYQEGKTGSVQYIAASGFENGAQYVIASEGYALNTEVRNGYEVTNDSGVYGYSGFNGTKLSVSGDMLVNAVSDDLLWTAVKVDGGFALKNAATGKYLDATYNKNLYFDLGKGGYIELGDAAEAWALDGSGLKHGSTGKYLNWETSDDVSGTLTDGETDLFTIRSGASAVTVYKACVVGGEAAPFSMATELLDGESYVISAESMGLTCAPHGGYTTNNGGNYSAFPYSGFAGAALTVSGRDINEGVEDDMLFTAEAVDGGFALRNVYGEYLCAKYGVNSDVHGGHIYFSDTKQAWTLDGSGLKNVTTGKYLNWEKESDISGTRIAGSADLFTIRSGAEAITVFKSNAAAKHSYVKTAAFEDGGRYVISMDGLALTDNYNPGYVTENGAIYTYYGFDGQSISSSGDCLTCDVTASMVWTAAAVDGGFAFMNSEGKYLIGKYQNGGYIALGDTPEAWYIGEKGLMHKADGKAIKFDSSATGRLQSGIPYLFTLRSSGPAPVIYKETEYTALPTAFSEIGHFVDGAQFVIVPDGHAMTDSYNAGYVTDAGALYRYYGFNGVSVTAKDGIITSDVALNMIWVAERLDNGFALKNIFGDYLNCEYSSNEADRGGRIILGEKPEAWVYSGGKLTHSATGKQLTWQNADKVTGTLTEGDPELVTIRTTGDAVKLYMAGSEAEVTEPSYYKAVKSDISTSGKYLIVGNGLAITAKYHDGFIYKNSNAMHYYGLTGSPVTVEGDTVYGAIGDDMVWTISPKDGGWYIQDQTGRYLCSAYNNTKNGWGYIALSDTPEIWVASGSGLKGQDSGKVIFDESSEASGNVKSGSVSRLFTVRSSATALSFYAVVGNVTVSYAAGEHGSVSRTKDTVNASHTGLRGVTAIPAPGYRFSCWRDENGVPVSTDADFIPEEVSASYVAEFVECEPVSISYVAGENGTVSVGGEAVAPATGTPAGATAKANRAYHFLNWTDANGKVVSTEPTFVPARSSDGIYVEMTYTANFEKDPVCIGDRYVAVKPGTVKLAFDGEVCGEFVLDYVGNAWSIYDPAQDMYLAFRSNNLKYTKEIFLWQYDGGFYSSTSFTINNAFIAGLLNFNKYYLTCEDGRLDVSRNAVDVNVIEHFVIQDHSFTQFVDNGDGTHTAICSVCGSKEVRAHAFDDHYCACGACDIPGTGVTNVNVTVTKTTKTVRFLFFFRISRTTYEADISCTTGGGVTVDRVQYRMQDNLLWRSGTSFSNNKGIGAFDIRVYDSEGNTTYWYYNGSTTERIG